MQGVRVGRERAPVPVLAQHLPVAGYSSSRDYAAAPNAARYAQTVCAGSLTPSAFSPSWAGASRQAERARPLVQRDHAPPGGGGRPLPRRSREVERVVERGDAEREVEERAAKGEEAPAVGRTRSWLQLATRSAKNALTADPDVLVGHVCRWPRTRTRAGTKNAARPSLSAAPTSRRTRIPGRTHRSRQPRERVLVRGPDGIVPAELAAHVREVVSTSSSGTYQSSPFAFSTQPAISRFLSAMPGRRSLSMSRHPVLDRIALAAGETAEGSLLELFAELVRLDRSSADRAAQDRQQRLLHSSSASTSTGSRSRAS